MRIKMKFDHREKIDALRTRVFSAGQEYDVDAVLGAMLVAAGRAGDVTPAAVPAHFTPRQTEVLMGIADHVAAQADAGRAEENGEVEFDLAAMTLEDLLALAGELGIETGTAASKDELIAAIQEAGAPPAPIDLTTLSLADLKALATELGVVVPARSSKAKIIDLIEAVTADQGASV